MCTTEWCLDSALVCVYNRVVFGFRTGMCVQQSSVWIQYWYVCITEWCLVSRSAFADDIMVSSPDHGCVLPAEHPSSELGVESGAAEMSSQQL